ACLGVFYSLGVNLEYGNGDVIWKGEEDIEITRADTAGHYNYRYYSPEKPVCGNGISECGEQCDCDTGTPQAVVTYCCSPTQPPGTGEHCSETLLLPSETCDGLGVGSTIGGFLACDSC
ncbi:unnamed protein product, partial [marine sediment metagenome]